MSQKCSENTCSYRGDSSQAITWNTSQLHSALQPRFWKGRWSENHQLCLNVCPQAHTEVRAVLYACHPLVEAWQYPALWWAMKGLFSPYPAGPDCCFVLAWLDDFSLPRIHPTSVGLRMGSFVSLFLCFPLPFPLLGFVFWSQMPGPICYCSSSCGFVWLGREKSSAQVVLCAPSICFDYACHKLPSHSCRSLSRADVGKLVKD